MRRIFFGCARVFEWFDAIMSPLGGWPVFAGIVASLATFIWGLIVDWGPATIPAVLMALGAGAVTVDALIHLVRYWRVRWSRRRKTAMEIFDAYVEGQRLLARLRSPDELSMDDAWSRVAEWNARANQSVQETPADETAGLWTMNLPAHVRASKASLETFLREKNEGKFRKIMLRAMKQTGLSGGAVFGGSEPPGNLHIEGAEYDTQSALSDIMALRSEVAKLRIEAEATRLTDTINKLTLRQVVLRDDIARIIRLGISHGEADAFITVGNLEARWPDAVNREHELIVTISIRDLDYLMDLQHRYGRSIEAKE